MDLNLLNKSAIVTGGSRGIGKAIARELAREGVREAFPAVVTARHGDHDVCVLGVEIGMGQLVSKSEHLPPERHLRVDRDAEARLRMVIEEA